MDKNLTADQRKVLVVDDESSLRELIKEILEMNGFHVQESSTVDAAIKILGSDRIDLVISDVVMTGKDGFQLLDKVQKEFTDVKIMLISGYNEYINQNIPVEIMNKPFKPFQLLERIEEILED